MAARKKGLDETDMFRAQQTRFLGKRWQVKDLVIGSMRASQVSMAVRHYGDHCAFIGWKVAYAHVRKATYSTLIYTSSSYCRNKFSSWFFDLLLKRRPSLHPDQSYTVALWQICIARAGKAGVRQCQLRKSKLVQQQ